VNRFVARYGSVKQGDAKTLRTFLDILVKNGVVSRSPKPAGTEADRIADEFAEYLQQERALAPCTISYYRFLVASFVVHCFGGGCIDLSAICPRDVIAFVRYDATRRCAASAKNTATALRSFLRYLQYRGIIDRDISSVVPSVAAWSLSNVPKGLTREQVTRVLASCNRRTAIGRRDYAVLLLLARLGLRAGEVANLTLDSIDWANGTISICGKGGKLCTLPLPVDVGNAIAVYLRKDRKPVVSRHLFLRIPAPHTGFYTRSAVGLIVKYALARAGINSRSKGAHQLRHALAVEMLKRGASLPQIGEVLRHEKPKTTFIYAKVDFARLRKMAKRWPGGVA
jgi:site-specific recombinase XerD